MSVLRTPLEKWLASPDDGKGLHHNIFVYAMFMVEEGHSSEEIYQLLREICDKMDRRVPDREINDAITRAYGKALGVSRRCVTWPQRDQGFRREVLQLYQVDYSRLIAQIPPDRSAADYLEKLYREEDLLCVGYTAFAFYTRPLKGLLASHKDLLGIQFINPSPMSAVAGLTADGKYSEHCSSNVGPRVYVVVEFDDDSWLEHAALLKFLATKLPLVMMVFSGGQSLHGWFKTAHVMEHDVLAFYELAVRLGADPKLYSPCQLARVPMGRNGLQQVIYFNSTNCYARTELQA
jgi:hypothetical protein